MKTLWIYEVKTFHDYNDEVFLAETLKEQKEVYKVTIVEVFEKFIVTIITNENDYHKMDKVIKKLGMAFEGIFDLLITERIYENFLKKS